MLGGLEFASLGAGGSSNCGVTTGGEGYCWGWNDDGQLGDGTTTDRSEPALVAGGLTFASIEVGGFHTCGVTAQGAAYCWGRNTDGQLGDGTTTASAEPVLVDAAGLTFTAITVGFRHSCGLTAAGAAYCWGSAAFGQLGHSSNVSSTSPVQVVDVSQFLSLKAGAEYTCGVETATDDAWCWGFNASGQLGADAAETCILEDGGNNLGQVDCSSVPVPVSGDLTFSSLSPNTQHTCGVARSGGVYCWGFGDRGQLGNGMSGTNYLSIQPVRVAGQTGA